VTATDLASETSEVVEGQLTTPNRSLDVAGDMSVYRRLATLEQTARRCCACSTSSETSTAGPRPGRPHRGSLRGDPLRQPGRQQLDRRGARQRERHGPGDTLRSVDALALKHIDSLGFSLRRPGDRPAAAPTRQANRPRRHGPAERSALVSSCVASSYTSSVQRWRSGPPRIIVSLSPTATKVGCGPRPVPKAPRRARQHLPRRATVTATTGDEPTVTVCNRDGSTSVTDW
jgi:hypothetical protein